VTNVPSPCTEYTVPSFRSARRASGRLREAISEHASRGTQGNPETRVPGLQIRNVADLVVG